MKEQRDAHVSSLHALGLYGLSILKSLESAYKHVCRLHVSSLYVFEHIQIHLRLHGWSIFKFTLSLHALNLHVLVCMLWSATGTLKFACVEHV